MLYDKRPNRTYLTGTVMVFVGTAWSFAACHTKPSERILNFTLIRCNGRITYTILLSL